MCHLLPVDFVMATLLHINCNTRLCMIGMPLQGYSQFVESYTYWIIRYKLDKLIVPKNMIILWYTPCYITTTKKYCWCVKTNLQRMKCDSCSRGIFSHDGYPWWSSTRIIDLPILQNVMDVRPHDDTQYEIWTLLWFTLTYCGITLISFQLHVA